MNIKKRSKRSAEFSMSSMTDIIFLLLIFFMLTSTLVAPNALNLVLPSSNKSTPKINKPVTVRIDKQLNYYLQGRSVSLADLPDKLVAAIASADSKTVTLKPHETVPIENVTEVMTIANELEIKMIFAPSK